MPIAIRPPAGGCPLNRAGLALILAAASVGPGAASARAQATPYRNGAPVYGTSWGVASYGLKRTTSSFASPWGVNYGLGTPPLGFVPGPYGADLWRPGEVAPAGTYGVAYRYRTWPYPYPPGPPAYGPSIGVYAPGFGPELRSPTAW